MESFSFLTQIRTFLRAERRRAPQARAFTLVEMLVVIAIIGIVTTVIITGQSTFSRAILLTDTAYTVALSVREAQTYGLSSHLFAGDQNNAYGLYFTPNSTSYVEFGDTYPVAGTSGIPSYCPGHTETDPTKPDARPGDCLYESGQNEQVRVYNFGQGYSIKTLSALNSVGTLVTPTDADVTFQRPNTTTTLVGTVGGVETGLSELHVRVASPQGNTECVVITQLGEVSVEQTCS